MLELRVSFLCVVLLGGCDSRAEARTTTAPQPTSEVAAATPAAPSVAPGPSAPGPESPALDPARGGEIGVVYEAFLTPHQEGDEEENTPGSTPKQFRSTTPSQSRDARAAAGHRAHGQVRFTHDFSRAFIDVKVEGIDPKTINMFHIHCGKPGILGPILLDFAHATDLQSNLADGVFSVEIRNEHLTKTVEHAHGVVGTFTTGCVIPSPSLGSVAPSKVSTVAGMAQMARDGELYFNLHTTGQTYFGDIRGQLHPAGGH